MSPRSYRRPSPRGWLALAGTVAVVLMALISPPAAHAGPSSPAVICTAAAKLNGLHLPQQVVGLITQDSASGAPLTCQAELTAATSAIEASRTSALEAETAAGKGDWAVAGKRAKAALELDAENDVATRVAAQAEAHAADAKKSWPENLAGWWDTTSNSYVEPVGKVAVPFLVILVALFVAARLLTIVPWRLPSRRGARMASAVTATAFGLASAALLPVWSNDSTLVRWLAALAAVVAAVTGSLWLASQLRIQPEVRGSDGEVSEARSGRLAALLGELAGEGARGLEIPRGADVDALANTPLAGTPEGTIAKLVAWIVRLLVGSAPWRVRVDEVDGTTLAISVSRNLRTRSTALIKLEALGLDVPLLAADGKASGAGAPPDDESDESDEKKPDPYRVAAAVVVVELARCHPGFEQLGPVSDWRSVGLHFVATTQLDHNPEAQLQALARAVGLDPGNVPAQVAHLYCLYRDQTIHQRVRDYSNSLTALLESPTATRFAGKQLQRRVLHSRLAAEINDAYVSAVEDGQPGPKIDRVRLKTAAEGLLGFYTRTVPEAARRIEAVKDPLTAASLPAAAAMLLWADDHTGFLTELEDERGVSAPNPITKSVLKTWLKHSVGPTAEYQVGCYLATGTAPRPAAARRLLWRGLVDPRLAAWLPKDPQLTAVLKTPGYRRAFGKDPRTDFLELAPVKGCAPQLAKIGVTTAEELLDYRTPDQLAIALGRPPDTARRLLKLARAATFPGLGKDFDDYRVELCHQALALQLSLPPVSEADAEIRADELMGALEGRCKMTPRRHQVVRWWLGLPATPPGQDGELSQT